MKLRDYISSTLPALIASILFSGCTSEIPMVNLGIDDTYYIARMTKLPLESALTGEKYLWKADGEIVSTERDYIFLASEEGVYNMSFDIIDDQTPFHFDFTVNVLHEEVEYSPYISRVYEYCRQCHNIVRHHSRRLPGLHLENCGQTR